MPKLINTNTDPYSSALFFYLSTLMGAMRMMNTHISKQTSTHSKEQTKEKQ